jgi:hypothetical protein
MTVALFAFTDALVETYESCLTLAVLDLVSVPPANPGSSKQNKKEEPGD